MFIQLLTFPYRWGDAKARWVIFLLLVGILAANSIVLNQYLSQNDPEFDNISSGTYTALGVMVVCIVALGFLVVFNMGVQSGYSTGFWHWVKLILFLGLVVWALVPELILLYSRPGCDDVQLEKAVFINAAISVAISSILIVWMGVSLFFKKEYLSILAAKRTAEDIKKEEEIAEGYLKTDKEAFEKARDACKDFYKKSGLHSTIRKVGDKFYCFLEDQWYDPLGDRCLDGGNWNETTKDFDFTIPLTPAKECTNKVK